MSKKPDSLENLFYNNIIIHPGSLLSYKRIPKQNPFINIGAGGVVDATLANNYYGNDSSQIAFVNYANADFRLTAGSPAIDAGFDMSAYGLFCDADAQLRPSGNAYDIGAYEFQDSTSFVSEQDSILYQTIADKTNTAAQNKSIDLRSIQLLNNRTQTLPAESRPMKVFNAGGQLLYNGSGNCRTLSELQLQKGLYFIQTQRSGKTITHKIRLI